MRPHEVERGQVADPLIEFGGAFKVGEQKGQAGNLEPLIGIDRVGAVEVTKHLAGQQTLGR